ncbi:MAG: glutaminyl-peptide cyclotransferase [Calditrichae bacterium]|nr:glutaminyl-peptide cyclotransferase [Calditrichia bacterium]
MKKRNIPINLRKYNIKGIWTLWILLLFLLHSCSENSPTTPGGGDNNPPEEIPVVQPEIVATYPHDSGSFTQGLLFHEGFLFEGSGRYGISTFRKVAPETGEVLHSDTLPNQYFGEGLALKNGRFVQLTWQSRVAFIYDATSLAQVDTFRYGTEGWGLTANDDHFIMSDGSSTIYFRDDNFKLVRTISVTRDGEAVSSLNELEFANELIYANVWRRDYFLEISPATGKATRVIDCSELVAIEQQTNPEHVLNGIAWRAASGTFFVTGKNWERMFEVIF